MAPEGTPGNGGKLTDYKFERFEHRVAVLEADMIDARKDIAVTNQRLAVYETKIDERLGSLTATLKWGLGLLTAGVTALTVALVLRAAGL